MAKRLSINDRTLRRLLKLADVPEQIIDAYGGQTVITVSHARDLMPLVEQSSEFKSRILDEAIIIANEQAELVAAGKPLISPKIVFARLKASTATKTWNDGKANHSEWGGWY